MDHVELAHHAVIGADGVFARAQAKEIGVVSGAAIERVVAYAAVERVVSGLAVQRVVAVLALQAVGSVATVE